jgi:hypothetical protein
MEGKLTREAENGNMGHHGFIVSPSTMCVVFLEVLNSCTIDVEKINN